MKGPDKPKWSRAMENEIGRLFQGIRDIEGTYTCFFIHKYEVPQDRSPCIQDTQNRRRLVAHQQDNSRSYNQARTNERGHFTRDCKPQEYRHLMKGPDKPKWSRAMENEIGRLFQGIRDIEGTYTCFFIHKYEVPQDRKVTYRRIVCNIRHQKK